VCGKPISVSAFLKKAYLVVMVGVVGIIFLAAVVQQGKVGSSNLSGLSASQKESGKKTRAVPVDGPEGDVPQKLLKELSREGR
jgi:hypothetical protein